MSFFNEGDSSRDFTSRVAARSGDIAGGIGKGIIEEATKNADSARENALAAVGVAGVTNIMNSILGDEDQVVPPQYTGNVDIEREDKLFLDSYKYASDQYFNSVVQGYEYQYNTNHPMMKSLFLVDFEFNQNIAQNSNRLKHLYRNTTSFLLKGMTFPRAEIEFEEINEYNHHRRVPKRISYTPITARFGDIYRTFNNSDDKVGLLDLYKEYMSYYYNDFERDQTGFHFGHNSDRTSKQFINSITIYFFWADGARQIKMINPMIKSFSYDEFNYDSDEQVVVSCDISYEYIDMSEMTINYDTFIQAASGLLEKISNGLYDTNVSNPYADNPELQPGEETVDVTRDAALDNPVSQTLIRLAEIEAINLASDSLNSDNAIERKIAESAVNVGTGAAGGVGGFLGGLF
jgi:hypothetical protein